MLQNSTFTTSETKSLAARLNRYAVVAVFLVLIALPAVWFGRTSFAPAPLHENRKMSPAPALSIHLFQETDRWFSDRFGMRDALVYYGSRLQMARTGTPSNQDVVIGPSKWLFYDQYYVPGRPHFADTLGKDPLSASQLRLATDNVIQAHRALAACGIPFYFVVAPDKQAIYPEKLGIHIPADAKSNADQLIESLRTAAPALKIIDLRGVVQNAKAQAPYDLYMRTDTHWNSLGAFYGYQAIMQRLAADRVASLSRWTQLSNWTVTQAKFDKGDIAVNLLSLPGYFEDYATRFKRQPARQAVWQGDELSGSSTNAAGKGHLVMYRDSFAAELMPFLGEDFATTWSALGRELDGDAIAQQHPNVVMLEIVARNIRMLKEPPVNMDRLCRKT